MLEITGRLKIGAWREAWLLNDALLRSSYRTSTQVLSVIAAPWKRSERTDWVWRLPDQEYPNANTFGGTCDTSMGGGWGRSLFETEVEAWAFAVGFYRTRIRAEQVRSASLIEEYAIELGETVAQLKLARLRHQESKSASGAASQRGADEQGEEG